MRGSVVGVEAVRPELAQDRHDPGTAVQPALRRDGAIRRRTAAWLGFGTEASAAMRSAVFSSSANEATRSRTACRAGREIRRRPVPSAVAASSRASWNRRWDSEARASRRNHRIPHRAAADPCRRPAADSAGAAAGHMDACVKSAARHVGRFILPAPIDERRVGMAGRRATDMITRE